jgi:hypothetical protein
MDGRPPVSSEVPSQAGFEVLSRLYLSSLIHLQRTALEIDGEADVTWPSPYYEERKRKMRDGDVVETIVEKEFHTCTVLPAGPQLFDWHKPYRWRQDRGYSQGHIDAFTFDASELAKKKNTAIKSRGNPSVPWGNKLTEASVGNLPKFLVYLFVHCLLGIFAFFTYTSCSGGHKNKSFRDFKCWFHGLPPSHEQHLKENYYYNHPQAFKHLPHDVKTTPLKPDNFLVSSSWPPSHTSVIVSTMTLRHASSGKASCFLHLSLISGTFLPFKYLDFFLSRLRT